MHYVASGTYRGGPIGRLLHRSLSMQGIRFQDLTTPKAKKLNDRYQLAEDLPPRLYLRLAALELLRLEGGSYLSEDVLAMRPVTGWPDPETGGLRAFRRASSGGLSSAIVQAGPDDPTITEALQRLVSQLRSSNRQNLEQRPTWIVDHALTVAAGKNARIVAWDEPAVAEVHPLHARRLGVTAPAAEPPPADLIILPLDELRQHDETELLLLAPDSFLSQSDSQLASLLRAGAKGGSVRRSRQVPQHLGGHKNRTNLDEGALRYLVDQFTPTTFTDLGCGPGGMVFAAEGLGLRAVGIDGDPTLPELPALISHDFATGPLTATEDTDLCWCVEFLEHVDERYIRNYSPILSRSEVVVATLAPPGQPGHHHVNCRPVSYWLAIFEAAGLHFDEARTTGIRKHSTMRSNFMRDNGYVFTRSL